MAGGGEIRKLLTDGKERSISHQMLCHMAVPLDNVKNEVQLRIFYGERRAAMKEVGKRKWGRSRTSRSKSLGKETCILI